MSSILHGIKEIHAFYFLLIIFLQDIEEIKKINCSTEAIIK